MEISIKKKDFPTIIDILKRTRNQIDIKIFTKYLEESNEFRNALIDYLKYKSEYEELFQIVKKLVNLYVDCNPQIFLLCEILEILIFDLKSKYLNNIFLQNIFLSCIMLVNNNDKGKIYREKLIHIFLKIKILSKDEIAILENVELYYLLGYYYYKNTTDLNLALEFFEKEGIDDNANIILEIKNQIQLKRESNEVVEKDLNHPEDFESIDVSPLLSNFDQNNGK